MKLHRSVLVAIPILLSAFLLAQQPPDNPLLRDLRFRLIGPFRGGRSVAAAGIPSDPKTFYFGATGGGVWKTTDAGLSWNPISDGFFKTGSVGAIAVADSDPNTIYVGMGEACVRGNASNGDGVYKSTDAGRTWRNIGLEQTYHIGAVVVHPTNPDIAYVAALGHLWGPNAERGVYRTTDGGQNLEAGADARCGSRRFGYRDGSVESPNSLCFVLADQPQALAHG